MKRFGALLLSALLTLALAGCGKEPLFTPLDGASAVSQEDSSLPEESSEIPESSLPESSEEPVADPYLGAPVPASDAVEETYFDDAIFVGDSLTYGLGAYQVLDAGRVVVDISGEDKKKLTVPDLLALFSRASGSDEANDKMLLS